MYLERIIRSHQAKQFEVILLPHQKAITPDGNRQKMVDFFKDLCSYFIQERLSDLI